MGETFTPDLLTGTGNLKVPISVPPGRNGLQPELSLVYSTGAGNGPFGLGWSLSAPTISRKTSMGVPRYRDSADDRSLRDTFLLSGAEDLVPVGAPEPGVTRFRPRTEGLFARIERIRDAGRDVWRVSGRDGLVSLYGAAGEDGDPAVVAHPDNRAAIYSWHLSETTDPFGNRIVYRYRRDAGSDSSRSWDQLYLEQIQYADFDRDGQVRFLVSVTFVYEQRDDSFSQHRSGFEIRTRLRCRRIEVRTHPDDDLLVRSYELAYLDDRMRAGDVPASELPRNGVSLLSRVRMVGHDGDRREELPPLQLSYTAFDPGRQRFEELHAAGDALPDRSLADGGFEMVDLFGKGLPDIVRLDGASQFWRNLGSGALAAPEPMDEVPVDTHLPDAGVRIADMNGDGRADLLLLPHGYLPLSFSGRWSSADFVPYSQPLLTLSDDRTRLVDLDGDGVVDALRTAEQFELFLNHPQKGWHAVEERQRRPLEDFPNVSFDDSRVKLADVSGDGLQDVVLVDGKNRVDYWPYLGHGRWGRRLTMRPVFRDALGAQTDFDPDRVLFGDLDGDGLDDVVYVDDNRLTFCLNRGGSGWSDPVTVPGTPPLTDIDGVRLADMLGTGMPGVLWTFDRQPGEGSNYRFLDPTGGLKPYLLDEVDNHLGARTRVRYASSTSFYLADDGNPETRWKTVLPFPVHVVERVEVVDEVSKGKLTSEFGYHHGYWDGAEREFRGFGRVEQLDTETFERFNSPGLFDQQTTFLPVAEGQFSPPTRTTTWFHVGPTGNEFADRGEADVVPEYWPGDPPALERPDTTAELLRSLPARDRADALRSLRGHVLRTELWALDGTEHERRPVTVTEFQYGIREVDPPGPEDARTRVFFPHLVAERASRWERGTEPMSQFAVTAGYDVHGLPGRHVSLAVPRGRDFRVAAAAGTPYLGTDVVTRYARRDEGDPLIVDRVACTTMNEVVNDGSLPVADLLAAVLRDEPERVVIGQTLTYYDGEAFTGLPLGVVGDFGAPVRTETLVLSENVLRAAYRSTDRAEPELPPYLTPDGPPAWTPEYPQPFRDMVPPLAGYTFHPGDADRARGYFATTRRQRYDVHEDPPRPRRGMLTVVRDALGHDTAIAYDRFGLLPQEVVDPVGLRTRAEYDDRVLQPSLLTDPNGNRTAYGFTPLGLLERTAVMGKDGEDVGDTLEAPGTRLAYDLLGAAGGQG
jgi:hypothetical protein